MAHHDDDTGKTTELLDLSSGANLAIAADRIKAHTSLDYKLGDLEAYLRRKVDAGARPERGSEAWYEHETLAAINHARHLIAHGGTAEELIIAGIRIGERWTEAEAKYQWPVTQIGRRRRRQERDWSAEGAEARRRDDDGPVLAAATAYRALKPQSRASEIARSLYSSHGDGRAVDSLRKQIARLLRPGK